MLREIRFAPMGKMRNKNGKQRVRDYIWEMGLGKVVSEGGWWMVDGGQSKCAGRLPRSATVTV